MLVIDKKWGFFFNSFFYQFLIGEVYLIINKFFLDGFLSDYCCIELYNSFLCVVMFVNLIDC